jgi:uncharacterized protein YbjT (DUF2867 family)
MKTALVIGATGLIGSHLVELLGKDERYSKIIILSRRKIQYLNPKKIVQVIDYDNPDTSVVKGDDVFCAIGTTIKKAGSKENQYRIDCEYPARLAQIAKQNGAQKFILVSSIGADPKASNFYLRTKGDLEEKLKAINFDSLVILRPSILLGQRREFRLGERIGIFVMQALRPLMIGSFKKYRGVAASAVAQRMLQAAVSNTQKLEVISSEEITLSR